MQSCEPAQMVGKITQPPNGERSNDRKAEPYGEPKASFVALL